MDAIWLHQIIIANNNTILFEKFWKAHVHKQKQTSYLLMRTSIRIIMPIVAMIVIEVIFSMRIFIVSVYPTSVVLQT